jgi:hypothetical protein
MYYQDFFTNKINILDCKVKIPRKIQYRGHPFYYPILKTLENISENICIKIENILSTPIWFNRYLKTQFDIELSRAGFNFIKDLFPCNKPLENFNYLRNNKIRKLRNLSNKIPLVWKDKVLQSDNCFVTISPHNMVNLNGTDVYLNNIPGDQIYRQLIGHKTRLPTGLLRWREDIELSDTDIKVAFTFARLCSISVFDHVFQYKILTRILPTNKYLKRYQVQDSDICSRCELSQDTVLHNLWQCALIVPYVAKISRFLKIDCKVDENITMKPYLFGFKHAIGLNHILLELKKEIFYNWSANISVVTFCEHFMVKIKKIMVKEKEVMISNDHFGDYFDKWKQFTAIYDFLGPDQQIIC